jgi:hypothetical protein
MSISLADAASGADSVSPAAAAPSGDYGEADDTAVSVRQSDAFPDIELLLVGWWQPQFPAARFATILPADIAGTTIHVTRISGGNRTIRVDRPVVDVDVYALDHATAVSIALGIQALVKIARNVVTGSGVIQSAVTVNGPRWLPEINPALFRRSATYQFYVHA